MIVLTGGAGFIGSCLLRRLNDEGIQDIFVVDSSLTPEKERNLAGKHFQGFEEKGKFLEIIEKDALDKKIDAVFHLGACTSTILMDVEYFKENNLRYSQKIAGYAFKKGARFIYASSAATYGDGSLGFKDNIETAFKLRPLNPYAESKQAFDLWLIETDLIKKSVGLKYFNVFGPNEYHKKEMRSLIAKSFDAVLREKKMKLFKSHIPEYGDGQQKRDFMYVRDAVDITYFFFNNRDAFGLFNVGTGKARTWNDLARALFMALGISPSIEYIDMPAGLRDKYQNFTEADLTKLKEAGYRKGFYELEEAVKEYAGFLKEGAYL